MKPNLYPIGDVAHATILAALRHYQQALEMNGDAPPADVLAIATNSDAHEPVGTEGIDVLCDAINCDGFNLAESIAHFTGDDAEEAFAVIQEGGSSCELYLRSCESTSAAEAFRIDCADDGGYRTSEIIEIPAALAAMGEIFYETAEKLVKAAADLEIYEDPDPTPGEKCAERGDDLESGQTGLCDFCLKED